MSETTSGVVGLYVQVEPALKTDMVAYRESTGRSLRWLVETGVRQVMSQGDSEIVPLCVRGKIYNVPMEVAIEYEKILDTKKSKKAKAQSSTGEPGQCGADGAAPGVPADHGGIPGSSRTALPHHGACCGD